MNVVLRWRASGALQNFDHAGELDDVGLIVEAPLPGVHQAVVVLVHGLVHPDGIGYVEADGHVQVRRLFRQTASMRGSSGCIPGAVDFPERRPCAFVVDFADAFRARFVAALEFLDGGVGETRRVVSAEIEAAPDFEAVGIFRILPRDVVERLCRSSW